MLDLLQQYAAAAEITLTDKQLTQFGQYQSFLITENKKVNLTRIIKPRDIVIRHFLDSLMCIGATGDLSGKRVIDVGSGAGFPGIPLKILYPDMLLTVTDSVAKKTRFLEALIGELGLTAVRVIHARVEELGMSSMHRSRYDWSMARAVARLPVLAEYLLPLVRVGGHILAQKGTTAADEIKSANHAIAVLGGGAPQLLSVELPEREIKHYLVSIPKIKKTPKQYPRPAGQPSKSPLQLRSKSSSA